ncbi:response regulator [Paludibacterium purpuratum]|uniref:Two-component system OmpR family response regulator/two-component system response regulator RstA n=1 Tax=Paludibacterium purpuratum TaxID=1144873 RepID=A0A4R7B7N1_9NEIS|nr:response regulator [Paludibacterium purpuratum]TDR80721.1 two-component system OmpR family response regulator/two-component system response regulator RstA [Paludibacterium purpuratum]
MSEHVFLVEDDTRLAELIAAFLGKNGYQVSTCSKGDEAEAKIMAARPDLVVLDLMLPGKAGFEICRDLRPYFGGRILMMTARNDEIDEILGLELGADDYLAKPVEPRKLLARVRALLRRGEPRQGALATDQLAFGQFTINQGTRTARLGSQYLDLTTAEFDLLWLLASHAGSIQSRDDILGKLRGIGFDGNDRSIDARISRLRKKLLDDPMSPTRIKTVRGKGYLFSKSDWELG